MNCKPKPCAEGMSGGCSDSEFISLVKNRDFEGAYKKITETNSLPAICGRVCPQETQCEQVCVRAIKGESVAIGRLERFVADRMMQSKEKDDVQKTESVEKKNKKVAVIGSGPAGIDLCRDLARWLSSDIFEAFHTRRCN